MLRIALCDDEVDVRDTLRIHLEKLLDENTEEIVYEFSSGINAVRWLKNHQGEVDLLFLDVEMPRLNGMGTARKIREFDKNIIIVFVTGYSDYVFDGYSVGAIDYIMKPVSTKRLMEFIKRVRELISNERDQVFTLKNTDGVYRIRLNDILYFYSERRKVILVTEEKEYPFYEKLNELEKKLNSKFTRIHQRYVVNAAKVDYIGNNCVNVDGIKLPMSRSLKAEAIKKMARVMLEGGL